MGSNKGRRLWRNALGIGTTTFFLTLAIGYVSQTFIGWAGSLVLSFSLLIIIIFTGILFDILGTAVAAAVEPPFHAKAAKKIPGAKEAVWLLRNADRVASFANDVVGDICGTLSGAIGAGILFRLVGGEAGNALWGTAMTAVIASLTVGGKAVGKRMALSEAEDIVFWAGRFIAALERLAGKPLVKEKFQKDKPK